MKVRFLLACALSAATLALNAPELMRLARSGGYLATSWRAGFRSTGETVDASRRMAAFAQANGKTVAYCRQDGRVLHPIERSRLLAMSWATAPHPVRSGPLSDVVGADAIVAGAFDPDLARELTARGFRIRESGGGVDLWCRGEGWDAEPQPVERRWTMEALSLAAFVSVVAYCAVAGGGTGVALGVISLSLLLFGAYTAGWHSPWAAVLPALIVSGGAVAWRRRRAISLRRHAEAISVWRLAVLCGLVAVYATLALTHTYVAPNGLGTVGGKARLMFLAGGWPDGFFSDPAFAVYQPAYPPGAALLVLWCDVLTGVCGEWLAQLLPCLILASAAGFLAARLKGPAGLVVALAAFLTPLSVRLATLTYPEVCVALCCLVGWERIRADRRDWVGWLVLGSAGWFKNEGLVYFAAVSVVLLATAPRGARLRLLLRMAAGVVLPVAWHLGCRLAGASLDGYLPFTAMRPAQFGCALRRALEHMFLYPWRYAFAYPLAVGVLCAPRWRSRRLPEVAGFALLAVFSFGLVFALSDTADFEWHLASLERLLWVPALLLLREIADPESTDFWSIKANDRVPVL